MLEYNFSKNFEIQLTLRFSKLMFQVKRLVMIQKIIILIPRIFIERVNPFMIKFSKLRIQLTEIYADICFFLSFTSSILVGAQKTLSITCHHLKHREAILGWHFPSTFIMLRR